MAGLFFNILPFTAVKFAQKQTNLLKQVQNLTKLLKTRISLSNIFNNLTGLDSTKQANVVLIVI